MKNLAQLRHFLIVGAAVGIIMPFFISICLFGTTLQSFVAAPQPTAGFWSGAPTAVPAPPPGPIRTWTGNAFSAAGGVVFILWSVIGAFAGEALALRHWRDSLTPTRDALLGSAAGSIVFIFISIAAFLK